MIYDFLLFHTVCMRFSLIIFLTLVLQIPAAHAGEENTNAMEIASAVQAGHVSRYERQVIIPGGPDGDMSPWGRSFDALMDNLEGLMADKIQENNRIAAEQAVSPGYSF